MANSELDYQIREHRPGTPLHSGFHAIQGQEAEAIETMRLGLEQMIEDEKVSVKKEGD